MQPDVSVIIPTYNRASLLDHAIATCFEGNEAIKVEVVVVDDGSTDGTKVFLSSRSDPRVRLFWHGHLGPQQARNRGLDEARGRYIKFLDDDDWLAPGLLADEVAVLDQSGADISVARVLRHNGSEPLDEQGRWLHHDLLVNQLTGALQTLTLRHTIRSTVAKALLWDETLVCGDDMNYFMRITAASRSWVAVDGYGFFRHHTGPRVTNSARGQSIEFLSEMVRLSRSFYSEGTLNTPDRRTAACIGLWGWIRTVSTHNHDILHEAWNLIREISGNAFIPPRPLRIMSWADSLWGPVRTDLFLSIPRRLRRRWRYAHDPTLLRLKSTSRKNTIINK